MTNVKKWAKENGYTVTRTGKKGDYLFTYTKDGVTSEVLHEYETLEGLVKSLYNHMTDNEFLEFQRQRRKV